VRDAQPVGLDAVDLAQTDAMNLPGRESADGGAAADVVQIPVLAAGQRGNAERGASVGRVVRGNESGKGLVGGQNFVGDGIRDCLGQSLLFFRGYAGRIFLGRP